MPHSGTIVNNECGGGMTPRTFAVNLAKDSAAGKLVKPSTGPAVGLPPS